MWFLYVVGFIVVAVVWLCLGSSLLCPECGIELSDRFGYPGHKVDYCRCGWRARS